MKREALFDMLEQLGATLFGSRAWGGTRPESDYDFFLPLKEAEDLKQRLFVTGEVVKENDYYISGYYVTCDDATKINVTGCKKTDLPAWKLANKMMLAAHGQFTLKSDRQVTFEVLLSILKKAGIQ